MENNFEQKNGLPALSAGAAEGGILGFDRDLFLSIIQYLNTKSLRNYVGLCEETFLHTDHRYYHIYRMKFDKIHVLKLLLYPPYEEVRYNGRLIVNIALNKRFILKESFLNTIFELKLRYNGTWIRIEQVDETVHGHYSRCSGIRFGYDYNGRMVQVHGNFWGKIANYNECYNSDCNLIPKQTISNEPNDLTAILDMREYPQTPNKQVIGCAFYFRLNGEMSPYVIANIPYSKKRIRIELQQYSKMIIISTTHLKHLPIDVNTKYVYYNSENGIEIESE
jgi:hypothetical protein